MGRMCLRVLQSISRFRESGNACKIRHSLDTIGHGDPDPCVRLGNRHAHSLSWLACDRKRWQVEGLFLSMEGRVSPGQGAIAPMECQSQFPREPFEREFPE